jgi:glycosyltransferase involved in cell wall biosynthesis
MPKISAVIITFNEEKNIERCLLSVKEIADEIIIVDSFSTDKTEEICNKYPVKFIKHRFEGYIEQKNWAIQQATYDYILSLDADEEISEELKKSIKEIKNNWSYDGYIFNRLTNYCGNWIRHTSWYPSPKLRLFDRKKGQWDGLNPHDKFVMDKNSKVKHVKGNLLHYSYYGIKDQINQINKFTDILANSYHQKGLIPNTLWHIFFHPLWRFCRDYFIKLGFLDGFYGLVLSVNGAYEVFLKYLKLKFLIQKEKQESPFRICFFNSSLEWNTKEEELYNYLVKMQDNGYHPVSATPKKSKLLNKIKSTKIHYFRIKVYRYNPLFNLISAIRFIKYLKTYRIASIVLNDTRNLLFVSFCAKFANINQVILQNNNSNTIPTPSAILNRLYFQYLIDKVLVLSDKKFYTFLLYNYNIVSNQISEKNISLDDNKKEASTSVTSHFSGSI